MKYNFLGKSDLKVSNYCLGTMTYGEQTSERDAHLQMDKAFDSGINFFDTAEMYSTCPRLIETAGKTEKIIGTWIKKNPTLRNKLILATKIIGNGDTFIRDGGPINRKSLKIALETSLKRLQTDYIDLYQLHWPNRGSYHFRKNWNYNPSDSNKDEVENDILEIVETLHDFKSEGKIRAFGLSNETCWGVTKYVNAVKKFDNFPVASIQNEYSLLCRLYDTDMNEMSYYENIPLLAYSPLAGGLLTGKYLNDEMPTDSRITRVSTIGDRVNINAMKAVQEYIKISKKFDIHPVHLALAFCTKRPFMGSVIFGATTDEQLDVVIKGLDVDLNDEIMKEISLVYKNYALTF